LDLVLIGLADEPIINSANLTDGYIVGEEFVYKLTIENAGGLIADNVQFDASLSNGVVRFNGRATLWYCTDANAGCSLTQTVPLSNTGSFTFTPEDLPAGDFFRVVIEATARQVGLVDMRGQLTYDNPPATQTPPLETIE
jgi:hypothetical protein